MSGYISLHRAIQKHWIYQEDRVFSKFEAWTDILMRVNHAEGKVMHNGKLETVQRGSTIWSLGDMETRWKWSNKKVKRFLDCLVSDQMLSYKSTTKKTYLTVENYDVYQCQPGAKAPQKHHEGTTEAFQKHTNNNVNNNKSLNKKEEEIKDTVDLPSTTPTKRFIHPTLEEVQAYCNERQNGVDAAKWINYYTSNGWKVGKNAMKDWKAAVRTWERGVTGGHGAGNSGSVQQHTEPEQDWNKFVFQG